MRKSGEFEIGILLRELFCALKPGGTTFKIGNLGKQIFWPTKCFPNSKKLEKCFTNPRDFFNNFFFFVGEVLAKLFPSDYLLNQ